MRDDTTTKRGPPALACRVELGIGREQGGRREQQDRAGAHVAADGRRALAFVADGMGGHQGGAQAAEAVAAAAAGLWEAFRSVPRPDGVAVIRGLLGRAHEAINAIGGLDDYGPRSTAVVLVIDDGACTWGHVGDSRLYVFRDDGRIQRTRDHSLVQLWVDLGQVSEADQATHPDQSRLIRSVGGQEALEIDFGSADLGPGDRLALCSDGIWEVMEPQELAEALAARDLARAAAELAAEAARRGGAHGDNATVVLVRLVAPAEAQALETGPA